MFAYALIASAFAVDAPQTIAFDVTRNGNDFGEHIVTLEPLDDGGLKATTRIRLEVKVGFIRVFNYRHDCTEIWRDGVVESLDCQTRKDGDDLTLTVRRDGDILRVSGVDFQGEAPVDVAPSSYWHGLLHGAPSMLNTETGEIMQMTTTEIEPSDKGGCFDIQSSLTLTLCYDDAGRWTYTGFEARGQSIEYNRRS